MAEVISTVVVVDPGPGRTLSTFEYLTIAPTGALIVPNGDGVRVDGFGSRVIASGAISAFGTGVRLGDPNAAAGSTGNGQLLVTAGATITSFGAAVAIHDTQPQVTNAGTLAGASGIFHSYIFASNTPSDYRIGNSGDILGGEAGIVVTAGAGTISNSGLITGGDNGLFAVFDPVAGQLIGGVLALGDDVVLDNSGTISASAAGGYGAALGGGALLTNTGRIATVSTDALRGAVVIFTDTGETARIVNGPGGEIVAGATAIRTGAGAETVRNSGTILGDVLLGAGDDTFAGKGGSVLGDVRAEAGLDRLTGGDGDDRLFGGDDDDVLGGGAGDDALAGEAGNDSIRGGTGDDRLIGSGGNDVLAAGAGEDDLQGGSGTDTLTGGAEDDLLTGGGQADVLVFRRGHGNDTVTDFQNGSDRLDLAAFGFASFAALNALARDTSGGLLLDLSGADGGTVLLTGLLKAQFDASDVLL